MKAVAVTDISAFAGLQAESSIFSSREWMDAYGLNLTRVGIYNDGGALKGGFYHYDAKVAGLSLVKTPPYSPHCGLFVMPDSAKPSSLLGFHKDVAEAIAVYLSDRPGAVKTLAFPPEFAYMHPFTWKKFKVVPSFTYRLDLSQSPEQLRGNYDPKHRNVIAKAAREHPDVGVNAESPDALIAFFSETLSATGARIYKAELESILRRFTGSTHGVSFSVRKNGSIIGCVFCVYDKHCCYYLLGGAKRTDAAQGVNNLLVDHAISFAAAAGCRLFDFEGSMIPGVEKFFRGFGPVLTPYFTVNKAWLPLEMMLKLKKREVF